MPRMRIARSRSKRSSAYPYWFYLPAFVVFFIFFLLPTFSSFYFSLTRWTLFDSEFIGLDNFRQFFEEPALTKGLTNTLIYAVTTSGLKVVLGMLLAVLLTSSVIGRAFMRSAVFFPVLVSTIGVGLTFTVLMEPDVGPHQQGAGRGRHHRAAVARGSEVGADVGRAGRRVEGRGPGDGDLHRGHRLGPARVLRRRASVDGATPYKLFRYITLPLAWPATVTVIILSLIGGLRSFDLIWAMTRGGPGFTSDVIASVIYKQYQAGFYGLSTAGNVVLFVLVTAIILPLYSFLRRREVQL